ncbi:ADP-ribosylation factor GTPase activating protein, ER-Golgi transport [Mortierella sp. GBA43]|nr:ADP-ribosylation factor GTPase activating protein, ER-Golgi transport [Mortierella sp. GBA43]
MTVGGNAAAREYFSKQPGVDNKDAKTRYSSKIGTSYKEKLAQKIKDDMIAHPGKQGLEPQSEQSTSKSGSSTVPNDEDDFFNNWNQPSKPSNSSTASSPSIGPPSVGFGAAAVATSTPSRTSSTASRPARSTLTPARKTGTASKPMKLGAKKAEAVSFEEAEARAKAEAERIERLGAEAVEQERLQKLEAEREAAAAAARVSQGGHENTTPSSYYQSNSGANKDRMSSEDMERLGMGMGRMSFGATPSSKPSTSTRSGFGSVGGGHSPQVEENVTAAREKFGNQKAISSDQYFGRNNYDSDAQAEASRRLQTFSGATSISSNQYFGRPDEPQTMSSEVSLASISSTISSSELAKKLGQTDLTSLKNAVQQGAGKVSPTSLTNVES